MKTTPANALLSVNLIFKKNDQVLLALRKNTGYADKLYNLVVGKVDAGETIYDAAIREAKEELNVDISKENLNFFMFGDNLKIAKPYDSAVHIFFSVDSWQGTITNHEPHKCEDVKFFSLNELPHNMTKSAQIALEYLCNPSDHKFYEYLEDVI